MSGTGYRKTSRRKKRKVASRQHMPIYETRRHTPCLRRNHKRDRPRERGAPRGRMFSQVVLPGPRRTTQQVNKRLTLNSTTLSPGTKGDSGSDRCVWNLQELHSYPERDCDIRENKMPGVDSDSCLAAAEPIVLDNLKSTRF